MRELDRWRYLWRQRRRRCLDLVVLHRDHRRVSNVARHRQDAKGDHDKEADEQRGVVLACVEIKILRRVRAAPDALVDFHTGRYPRLVPQI